MATALTLSHLDLDAALLVPLGQAITVLRTLLALADPIEF